MNQNNNNFAESNMDTSSNKIRAKKSLGQHFLKNNHYLNRIISSSIQPISQSRAAHKMSDVKHFSDFDTIVEIGPGTGLLTDHLIKLNKQVICIEKDTSLAKLLTEKYSQNSNIQIIHADALYVNWKELNTPESNIENSILIANLPYNVSVPLIIHYIQNTHLFKKYSVLIQKEVAQRLAAKPDNKHYGRLAVLAQVYCDVKIHFDIPGNAFTPSTKVTSSFITIQPKPLDNKDIETDFNTLSNMLQIVFNHKRKMLRSTIGKTHPAIFSALLEEGVQETARPENITLKQFINCTKKLNQKTVLL